MTKKLSLHQIAALVFLAGVLAGCNGITANARYSTLIDQTTALSHESRARADLPENAGGMSRDELVRTIDGYDQVWQDLHDGLHGAAATQPGK